MHSASLPASRILMAALLISAPVLAACGGDAEKDDGRSSPTSSAAPALNYTLSASFADPGGQPSRENLAALDAALEQEAGTELAECPLGSVDDFIVAPLNMLTPKLTEFRSVVSEYGAFGAGPAFDCVDEWMRLEMSASEKPESIETVLRGITEMLGDHELSSPEPLLGGQAVVYSYTNQTTDSGAVGAAWSYDRYVIKATLFSGDLGVKDAAEWFAAMLPNMVAADSDGNDADAGLSPSNPYSDAVLRVTDEDGWMYDFTPSFTELRLSDLESSIEFSPPGQARWTATLEVPATFDATYANATPERTPPDTPYVEVQAFFTLQTDENGAPSGPCDSAGGIYLNGLEKLDYGSIIGCELLKQTMFKDVMQRADSPAFIESDDLAESDANRVVAELDGLDPIIYVDFNTGGGCQAIYRPDGTVEIDDSSDYCGVEMR